MSGAAAPEELEPVLGHRFRDPQLLRSAVAHPSSTVATGGPAGYERLEFLGDRVLALVVAELLFQRFPKENEGELSRRHVGLVRREALLRVAREIGLDRFLELAPSPAGRPDQGLDTALADGCEALIGALYLDGGIDAARRFIHTAWAGLVEETPRPPRDAKTALQEWAQARRLPLPAYAVTAREGPPHAPRFTVEVRLSGAPPTSGEGLSKRAAEQIAAAALLERLEGHDRTRDRT
ncbi:MAG: ribonuclease III [Alphaproteobacteria bacterium]